MLINEDDLEAMINFTRTACVKNDIRKPVIVNFLEFLYNRKEDICHNDKRRSNPIIDSLEQQKKFEMFIERFFNRIEKEQILNISDSFELHEAKQELVNRITRILHCQNTEDLEIDRMQLDNLPYNSDDPMFLAADCFHDSLIEIGVNQDSAETARKAFLSLKKNTMEVTQNKIRKIASKITIREGTGRCPFSHGREESKEVIDTRNELSARNELSSHVIKKDTPAGSGVAILPMPANFNNDENWEENEKEPFDSAAGENCATNQVASVDQVPSDQAPPDQVPPSYSYNLHTIYPRILNGSASDDEISKKNQFKLNIKEEEQDIQQCTVIHEGNLNKLINKHHNLVKRYLVLNSYALFVYKDEGAFRSSPMKPSVVIPMGEVSNIAQREFSTQAMLKSQNASSLKGQEIVYVLEIQLK